MIADNAFKVTEHNKKGGLYKSASLAQKGTLIHEKDQLYKM